ncbi:MAG: amidohydrolase [Chitinophagaceae bacterium]|nr:MAG: amidohydrolase [Chitinophagaceae bacterium]
MKKIYGLLLLPFLFSCSANKNTVDLLVKNAWVYTVNPSFDSATTFVVKEGKIIEVGDSSLEKKYIAKEIYDANGKTIVPGFIDAHAHLYGLGLYKQAADLMGTNSFEEILERLVQFQKENNSSYIIGRGWDQNDWPVKVFPTKEKLDALFPNIPVALTRVDGHAMLVNSKALELAGITANTKMAGGEVILHNGIPTGVLIDSPMELVEKTFPPQNSASSTKALLKAENIAFSYGLTTVDDAGLDRSIIELIDSLQKTGSMQLKVYAMISNTKENLDYYLNKGIYKTDRLNVRSFKIYTDGALGSRGAAMRTPYSDQHNHFGAMITPVDSLDYIASRIAKSAFQMNSHAIGDSATISVLRSYQKALENAKDRRWRVEHAQIISPEGFDFFNSNIIPSVQPTHATSDMYWAQDRIGAIRMKGAYAYQTLLKKSGMIALGTDFPVEQVNPIYTFYAAVIRKDLKHWPDAGFQMQDALTREQALRGMTFWAAFSNFEENEKGSIEKNKWADFTVLDQNIMQVDEQALPNTKVIATFVNGKKVFEKK